MPGDSAAAPDDGERRAATLEEARALAHPVRLRILRQCKDEALTNQDLAARLGLPAGTVLHHVRTLVATGFLVESAWRPGARGTTEKPYRSTGKSWRLDIGDTGESGAVRRAVFDAVAAEVDEAGPDSVVDEARMSMRLRPDRLDDLSRRISQLVDEFANADDPGGDPFAMLFVLHRRPTIGTPNSRRPGDQSRHH